MSTVDEQLRARFGAVTSEQVAALDHAATECGVTVMQLMEVAGWQVARSAWAALHEQPAEILVVSGRGNNGGDGLVAARHLATWGCPVRVHMLAEPERVTGLAAQHAESARANGVEVTVSNDADDLSAQLHSASLVLDGLLGTGLTSAPREPQASTIRALNASGMRVLSIDVPSGLDASSGEAPGACVKAAVTCTLAAMKAGLWSAEGRSHAGRLFVADIGMPAAAWQRNGLARPTDVVGGALLPV